MLKQLDPRLSIHVYAAACLSRTASAPFPSPAKGSSVTTPSSSRATLPKSPATFIRLWYPWRPPTSTSANSTPDVRKPRLPNRPA